MVHATAPNIVTTAIQNVAGSVDDGGVICGDPRLDALVTRAGRPRRTRFSDLRSDAGDGGGSSLDQRGSARPVDHPSIANAFNGADIGAVEN
jgi:hypothetical protein